MKITTEIIINASLDKVWLVLTNFKNYPNWNPFILSIEGEMKVGKKLEVIIKSSKNKSMKFRPTVINMQLARELRWKGKFLSRGVLDGEHYFTLENIDSNTTKFIHGENFTGILVGLFRKQLMATRNSFILMNKAIKAKCENHQPY